MQGKKLTADWQAFGGACLTAATKAETDANGSKVPGCVGLPYYTSKSSKLVGGVNGRLGGAAAGVAIGSEIPDAVGFGALRLTNGDFEAYADKYDALKVKYVQTAGFNGQNQFGAVVSNFTFDAKEGVDIRFDATAYGGNKYESKTASSGKNPTGGGRGADGMSFFLADGAGPVSIGSKGGSLGYSCSNGNGNGAVSGGSLGQLASDGVRNAYLGVGIDEFGNFTNKQETTNSGAPGVLGYLPNGEYRLPGSITLRGKGNIFGGNAENTCKGTNDYKYLGHSALYQALNEITSNGNAYITNQQGDSMPKRANANKMTYHIQITKSGRLNMEYSWNEYPPIQAFQNEDLISKNGALPSTLRFGFAASTGGGSNVHEITCFKANEPKTGSGSAASNTDGAKTTVVNTQVFSALSADTNHWGRFLSSNILTESAAGKVTDIKIDPKPKWDAACILTGDKINLANGWASGENSYCSKAAMPIDSSGYANGRNIITFGSLLDPLFSNLFVGTRKGKAFKGLGLAYPFIPLQAGTDGVPAYNTAGTTIKYLRGDRRFERDSLDPMPSPFISKDSPFRHRTGILGDISNSSAVWVGAPNSGYEKLAKDQLTGNTVPESGTYASFKTEMAGRTHVSYIGANDGFVHAFRAGATKADGSLDQSLNDGTELLAYMPASVIQTIKGNMKSETTALSDPNNYLPTLDYTSMKYSGAYFVDATPGYGDLYYNGKWHTWLVGGTGAGANFRGALNNNNANNQSKVNDWPDYLLDRYQAGAGGSLYILNITDPSGAKRPDIQFNESKAEQIAIMDWQARSLSCKGIDDEDDSSVGEKDNCGKRLGNTYGTPHIVRMHDGSWRVLFGNGFNSHAGAGGIFAVKVSDGSGEMPKLTPSFIGWGHIPGSTTDKNGISGIAPVDLDGDKIIDYIYAGDLKGNLWRFDVTAANDADWLKAAAIKKIYQTPNGAPITTAPAVGVGKDGRVVVTFSSGQRFPKTLTKGEESYNQQKNAMYGIWDWDMTAWNAKSSKKMLSLTTLPATANLVQQTYTNSVDLTAEQRNLAANQTIVGTRTVTRNEICWAGSSICNGGNANSNNNYGWFANLPSAGEQVVYEPVIKDGALFLNTIIPGYGTPSSCDYKAPQGYTMAVDYRTGGATAKSVYTNDPNDMIGGLALNAAGTPFFLQIGDETFMGNQLATPDEIRPADLRKIYPVKDISGWRRSWRQVIQLPSTLY